MVRDQLVNPTRCHQVIRRARPLRRDAIAQTTAVDMQCLAARLLQSRAGFKRTAKLGSAFGELGKRVPVLFRGGEELGVGRLRELEVVLGEDCVVALGGWGRGEVVGGDGVCGGGVGVGGRDGDGWEFARAW